jgi:stage V sporulation protein B
MNKNKIVSGAFTLFVAGAVVKILGLVFKIPIQYLIGDTGMGYFNIAYNIYAWFYIVSNAGLPVSVSISVARADAAGDRARCALIFRSAVTVFSAAGLLCSLSMLIFNGALASASSVYAAKYCIAAIAPAVFFGCISSAVRGYYQGFGIMWPSAVSQIAEALGKLAFGLIFAYISSDCGDAPYITAAYTVFGVSCGSALSALFCITVKCIYKRYRPDRRCVLQKNVIKELIKTAIPVTVSSAVMNLTGLIDVFSAPSRLMKIGYTELQSTEIFGNYTTLAVPMMNLPLIFVYPITNALLPAIAAGCAASDRKKTVDLISSLYRSVITVSLPCAVGLSVMAGPILSLIFAESSASLASPMLTVLAPASALSALLAASDTVLSAKGKAHLTIFSMIAGSVVKFLSTMFLTAFIGRLAVPLGTCLCYLTAVMSNLILSRERSIGFDFGAFIKPVTACALCGITAYYTYELLCLKFDPDVSCILSIPAAAAVYFITLYLCGFFKNGLLTGINDKIKRREV